MRRPENRAGAGPGLQEGLLMAKMEGTLPVPIVSADIDGVVTNRVVVKRSKRLRPGRRPRVIPKTKLVSAGAAPRADAARDYIVVCISTYPEDPEDLALLDVMVDELKLRGHRKVSRSWLIRHAISHLDIEAVFARLASSTEGNTR